ncbi:PadR family transcriptional regulator [Haloarcula laminariae]|uniref:PadR family transcriptional regulator n=1 Tax=Haloarcula laminariae TaxID=2961577 RepID=UPI0021C5AA40|nr:PadR family transcriptional regulator [Halomicroarcula laminariae]
MTTYHDLTGFRRDCLQAIAACEGEPYGLALKEWLDDRYSEPINHSRLYQNLDRLVEDDLVAVAETTTDDERRTVYTLTDTGRQLLEAHAGEVAQLQHQGTLIADGGHKDTRIFH